VQEVSKKKVRQEPAVPQKKFVYLDRETESSKKLDTLALPNKKYKVEDRSPHRITSPSKEKKADHGIAILDTVEESLLYQSSKVELFGSHLSAVRAAFPDSAKVVEMYSVGVKNKPKSVDFVKVNQALGTILLTHKNTGVTTVNCSFGWCVSIDALNKILQTFGEKSSKNVVLTRDNISKHSKIIRYALENIPPSHKEHTSIQCLFTRANLVQQLNEQGVMVVQSAGNSGPDHVMYLAALVPDVVVVGGLNGSTPDKQSSNTSLVDAWKPFRSEVKTHDGRVFPIAGTSVAAPSVTAEVKRLQEEGYGVKEVNTLYQTRSRHQLEKTVDKVILRDAHRTLSHLAPENSGEKLQLQSTTLLAVEPMLRNEAAYLEIAGQSSSLTLGEALDFTKSLDAVSKDFTIDKTHLAEALSKYAKQTGQERTATLNRIEASKQSYQSIENILSGLFR